eukprot:TRINITY_DN5680_c0_g1_i2.p1 TRINITY_DN5680_c0_g1~~TRINITY_DN5680_c0_g1_i2.p1  ORF type:complete len:212 (+),score=53.83 TRINITY_DN5680_c0_g1_i2:65-700(+)
MEGLPPLEPFVTASRNPFEDDDDELEFEMKSHESRKDDLSTLGFVRSEIAKDLKGWIGKTVIVSDQLLLSTFLRQSFVDEKNLLVHIHVSNDARTYKPTSTTTRISVYHTEDEDLILLLSDAPIISHSSKVAREILHILSPMKIITLNCNEVSFFKGETQHTYIVRQLYTSAENVESIETPLLEAPNFVDGLSAALLTRVILTAPSLINNI